MRNDICIYLSPANRARLERLVAARNTRSKVIWRAGIVLATADGLGTVAIMGRTGKSKPCVWRWQERYVAEGVEGLLRDKTRPARKKPLAAEVKLRVLTKTANEMPANATHWSVRTMANERAAHLGRGGLEAAFDAQIQAVQRSEVRRKGHRRRRPLHEPAGQGAGALRRREKPDPGARPHATGPAYEEGPCGHNDTRLQAQRHNNAVRRARCEDRRRHRRMFAAPSRQRIHPVPEEDRQHCGRSSRSPSDRR